MRTHDSGTQRARWGTSCEGEVAHSADPTGGRMIDSTRRISVDAMIVGSGYAVAFLYPLVSLSLLSRVLGAELLGVLMLALAVLQVVVLCTDYGFTLSSLRRITVSRESKERGEVNSSTLAAKGLLFLLSGAAVIGVALLVPSMKEHLSLYLWGLLLVAAGAAFPSWLLQGLGRLRLFAALIAASRVVALVGLVLTVRSRDDLLLALVWQLLPLGLAAVGGWAVLLAAGQANWLRPTWMAIRFAFRDGAPLFLTSLALLLTSSSNTLVLGAFASTTQVAYFGASERFANAGRGIMQGLQNSMLPRMIEAKNQVNGRQLRRFIILGFLTMYMAGGLVIALNAQWFVPLYLGEEFRSAVPMTQVVGIALCIAGGGAVFRLVAGAEHRYVAMGSIQLAVGVAQVLILIPMALHFGAMGVAITVLIGELVQVIAYSIDYRRCRRRHGGGGEPGVFGNDAAHTKP